MPSSFLGPVVVENVGIVFFSSHRVYFCIAGALQVLVRPAMPHGSDESPILQTLSTQQVFRDRNEARVHPHCRGEGAEAAED